MRHYGRCCHDDMISSYIVIIHIAVMVTMISIIVATIVILCHMITVIKFIISTDCQNNCDDYIVKYHIIYVIHILYLFVELTSGIF